MLAARYNAARYGGSCEARQQRRGIRAVHRSAQRARPERIDARDGGLDRHKRIVGAEDDLRRRYERRKGGEACRRGRVRPFGTSLSNSAPRRLVATAIRPESIGTVPPALVKMKRISGLRDKVPLNRRLMIARVISCGVSAITSGTPETTLPQHREPAPEI